MRDAKDWEDTFRIRGNAEADRAANEAHELWSAEVLALAAEGLAQDERVLSLWVQLAKLHVEVAKLFADKRKANTQMLPEVASVFSAADADSELGYIRCIDIPAGSALPAHFVVQFRHFLASLQWRRQVCSNGGGAPLLMLVLLFYNSTGTGIPLRQKNGWKWPVDASQSIRHQANLLLVILQSLCRSVNRELIPGFRSLFRKVRPFRPIGGHVKWKMVPYFLSTPLWKRAETLLWAQSLRGEGWLDMGLPEKQFQLVQLADLPAPSCQARAELCEAEWLGSPDQPGVGSGIHVFSFTMSSATSKRAPF